MRGFGNISSGLPAFAMAILAAAPALAHVGGGDKAVGFVHGFLHPLGGVDHMVAMLAVGLWGAFLGQPAIWLLPVVFPLVMALGGAIGAAGIALPNVEIGIALSAVLLGAMVAAAIRAPLGIAALLVGAFAIFHGHAHGTELPRGADAFAYSAGFVIATGLLHLAGIGLSGLSRWPAGAWLVRGGGVAIALTGVVFLGRSTGVWL